MQFIKTQIFISEASQKRLDKICKVTFLQEVGDVICFSRDTPDSGSGDHENYFGADPEDLVIHEVDGTRYGGCKKKAINIREIDRHVPWHSSVNNMIFSDVTNKFITITDENIAEAKNSIKFEKAVNSKFG